MPPSPTTVILALVAGIHAAVRAACNLVQDEMATAWVPGTSPRTTLVFEI